MIRGDIARVRLHDPQIGPAEVRRIVRQIVEAGAEAVAVCLLHSYANPANEDVVARELERSGLLHTVS
ncbi:MAG TPA: hypothetical protein ENO03_06840, partial [Candidatus Aminicenantes bacterium]|nr:hypothetical protein [Candidatus Aminicenantes bacterium]